MKTCLQLHRLTARSSPVHKDVKIPCLLAISQFHGRSCAITDPEPGVQASTHPSPVGDTGCPQPHSDTLGPHLLGRMTSSPTATKAALGNLGEGAGGGAHVGTGDGACSETALRFWQGSRAFVLKLCLHAFDQTCLTFLVRDSSKTRLIQG